MSKPKIYYETSELWVPEFYDVEKVLEMGAKKYAPNDWLKSDGKCANIRSMHDSMFHHLAESFCGKLKDGESGLDPLLHLACRALMCYARRKRGIDK